MTTTSSEGMKESEGSKSCCQRYERCVSGPEICHPGDGGPQRSFSACPCLWPLTTIGGHYLLPRLLITKESINTCDFRSE